MNNLALNHIFVKAFLFMLIIGGLHSCCRSSYNCPPGNITNLPYQQLNLFDTVTFNSNTGIIEHFVVTEKSRSSSYSGKCSSSGMYCTCDVCDTRTVLKLENTNLSSTLKSYNIYVEGDGNKLYEGYTSPPNIRIDLSSNYFGYNQFYHDSIFSYNYALNNTVYDSLAILEQDSLNGNSVYKLYYSVSKGVVCFKTTNPNETYYLQE